MTKPNVELTETLIEGYRSGAIGNAGAPKAAKPALAEMTPPPGVEGESFARRRKAAKQRPESCPIAAAKGCNRTFNGHGCCQTVAEHYCQPPAAVRLLFGKGLNGVVTNCHIRIAAGYYRDAKTAD